MSLRLTARITLRIRLSSLLRSDRGNGNEEKREKNVEVKAESENGKCALHRIESVL